MAQLAMGTQFEKTLLAGNSAKAAPAITAPQQPQYRPSAAPPSGVQQPLMR